MNKKRLTLLLAMFLMLGTLLVACNKKPATDTTAPADATQKADEKEKTDDKTAEEPKDDKAAEVGKVEKFADKETLVVAAADLNGDYINGFTNSTYDVWIKRLIGNYGGDLGYSTVYYDKFGEFKVNPTVAAGEPKVETNQDGSKTYTWKIVDNLVWNDGTPITAKDYVFGVLFYASPEWLKTGASNSSGAEDLLGFDDFHAGKTTHFPGIKLIDDKTFSVTLKAEKVPYFYELSKADVSPTPMHRFAPNLDVVGDELVVKEGYQVTDADKKAVIDGAKESVKAAQEKYDAELKTYTDEAEEYKQFNAEGIKNYEALLADYEKALADEATDPEYKYMLDLYAKVKEAEKTVKGYEDGSIELSPYQTIATAAVADIQYNYRFKPDVTCGPYNFVEMKNNMAKVTINDKFVGNAEGKKPTIKNVVVQTVNPNIDVELAIAGTIDVVQGVMEGAKIDKAKELTDKVGFTSYLRNGYGVMPILTDMGATKYKGVRQAIAYSLDRNEFVQTIAGGYGAVINGAFGMDEFEYREKGEEFNSKAINYTKNADAANKALDTTPYKFEKDGKTPWDVNKAQEAYNSNKEGFDYWRYDEAGNKLQIIHEGTKDLNVSEMISSQIPDNGKLCGMQYIFKPVDFATMIEHQTHPNVEDKEAPTVFNMGTNFGTPHDNYYQYHSSQIGVGDNKTRTNDPELDKLLVESRRLDPKDKDKWLDGWLKFQLWYNDNLPEIPLYANEYYDIFTTRVKGMDSTPFYDWSSSICNLSIAE